MSFRPTTYNLLPTTCVLLLLSACTSNVGTLINDATQTASGAVSEAKVRVEGVVEPMVETVEEANERLKTVKEGLGEVGEGMGKIKEGMSR